MKKRIFAVLLTAVLLALPSCKENTPSYRSDKTSPEVYSAVAEVVSPDAPMAAVDTDYIRYRMMLDTTIMENYAIYMQNTGSSLDEIGIIKAIGNDTAAVEKACKAVPGTASAVADLDKKQVTVRSGAALDALEQAIIDAGYTIRR